nr:hypothetical protein MFLOJ_40100 [Mycobacterium florentinum]
MYARLTDSGMSLRGPVTSHRGGCGARRAARLREKIRARRVGAVGAPGGRGPDDGAVGQVSIAPCTEGFESVMLAAQAFEILRHCQPARRRILVVERDGVVEIAHDRRAATSREATGQIPATNEAFQRRGGLIAQRLGRAGDRISDEK